MRIYGQYLAFSLLAISLLLSVPGCIRPPTYTIKASTPAYIEVEGVIVCEKTPCQLTPPYTTSFGMCDRMGALQSTLTAFPLDKSKGYVQAKTIRTRCNEDKTVYFDMDVTGGVQTIPVTKD
jgi:hypothetical protein